MRQAMMVVLLLALAGCGSHTSVVLVPCDDADVRSAGDGGLDDAEPAPDQRITAIAACGWIGGIYGRKRLEGNLPLPDPTNGIVGCEQAACPFPYDNTGRTDVRCDTAEVEACVRELEGGANDCETYALAIERCITAAETCGE